MFIRTKRLELRPFERRDLDALYAIWTDRQVRNFLWDDEIISRDRAEAEIRASINDFAMRRFGRFAITMLGSYAIVGFAGLRLTEGARDVELIYGLSPDFQGRGFASEASRAVLGYGFEELRLARIVASADAGNTASIAVMRRLGMTAVASRGGLSTYSIARQEFTISAEVYRLESV